MFAAEKAPSLPKNATAEVLITARVIKPPSPIERPVSQRAARLHGAGMHAIDAKAARYPHRRSLQRRLGRLSVADLMIEGLVVGAIGPDRRRARLVCILGRNGVRQLLVIHVHAFRRVASNVAARCALPNPEAEP